MVELLIRWPESPSRRPRWGEDRPCSAYGQQTKQRRRRHEAAAVWGIALRARAQRTRAQA
eukprot:3501823-Alexandrium_andersonii.AAC.1